MVHEFGATHGHIRYEDRNQKIQQCPVDWKI
jgi:hypothetical protein